MSKQPVNNALSTSEIILYRDFDSFPYYSFVRTSYTCAQNIAFTVSACLFCAAYGKVASIDSDSKNTNLLDT